MTALRRLVAVWTSGMGAVVAVALVGLSAVVVGTPAWWVSLFATAIAGAVVAIVGARVLRTDAARTALAAAVCVAVVAAAGGFVGVAAHEWSQARAVSDARSRVATIGAPTVCRVVERGTPARDAEAIRSATGDLAERLRSGAAVVGSDATGSATCRPVETAVGAASADAVEVVALIDVTSGGTTTGQVVSAGLRRVDGHWAVASLQVLR
ncbi:hypothetical protein ACXVUM_02610 [Williamsia sp. SKLECPSW1]